MKLVFASALLSIIPLLAETVPAGIAAKVNGEVITTVEVDNQVESFFAGTSLQGERLDSARREYRAQILRALIERELILQSFRNEGEKMPDGLVDQNLNSIIATTYRGDRDAFLTTISGRGITFKQYRQEIADNWIIGYMRKKHPSPGWSHSLLAAADITTY